MCCNIARGRDRHQYKIHITSICIGQIFHLKMFDSFADIKRDFEQDLQRISDYHGDKGVLQYFLDRGQALLKKINELLQYTTEGTEERVYIELPQERIIEKIAFDVKRLELKFNELLYHDSLNGEPEPALAYLRQYPEYIRHPEVGFILEDGETQLSAEFPESFIAFELIGSDNKNIILRGIADIIDEITKGNKNDKATRLAELFVWNIFGKTPAQNWAFHDIENPEADSQLGYIRILFEPYNVMLILSTGLSYASDAYEETDEENEDHERIFADREAYRQRQLASGNKIHSPIAEKMNFVISMFYPYNNARERIFDDEIISGMLRHLNEYIDSPYLLRWIEQYSELLPSLRDSANREQMQMLSAYLLDAEIENAWTSFEILREEEGVNDEQYHRIPTSVLSYVTERSRTLR